MSGRLPLDLEREVLSRLPAKQLISLRCVCKRWREEIDTPDFVKSHTRQVHKACNNNNNNGSLIFYGGSSAKLLLSTDLLATVKTLTRYQLPPWFNPNFSPVLVGSSNGILCFEENLVYSLYNPTTITANAKYICARLPSPQHQRCYIKSGFGYDCMSDDYKILRLYTFDDRSYVYSLKSNSWKFIQPPFPIRCEVKATMVLSNNALHFIGYESRPKTVRVYSFDLGTEEYHQVTQFNDDNDFKWVLAHLNGRLHLFLFTYSKCSMRIWVMKKCGTKMAMFVHNRYVIFDSDRFSRYCERLDEPPKPYAYSKDGSEILMVLGRGKKSISIVRCDLRNGMLTKEAIFGLPIKWWSVKRFAVLPWVGSLLVLPSKQK